MASCNATHCVCYENLHGSNAYFLGVIAGRKEDEKVTEMDQTIVWCHDCKNFLEYTKEYTQTVDGANGDCYIRLVSGADKQFCACKYDDFCSYGKRKGGDRNG